MQEYAQYQRKLIEKNNRSWHENTLGSALVRLLLWIGPRAFWCKIYFGIQQQAFILKEEGQSLEALRLLIHSLQKEQFWYQHPQKWWHLMQIAVQFAQDLELNATQRKSEPIHQLMNLCLHAPQPWQGFDVAYCFVALSLWSYERGKINHALSHVRTAIHADRSWGYPEYLLGWYGLSFEGIDSVAHFVKAVKNNWQFLQRLKQDPLCKKFPNILHEVNQYFSQTIVPLSS